MNTQFKPSLGQPPTAGIATVHAAPLGRKASVPIVRVDPRKLAMEQAAANGATSPPDFGALLSKAETAKRISRSVSWLDAAIANGDFPRGVYVLRTQMFPEAWVAQWINAQVMAQLAEQAS